MNLLGLVYKLTWLHWSTICAILILCLISVCDFWSVYLIWKFPKAKVFLYWPIVGHLGLLKYARGTIKETRELCERLLPDSGRMIHLIGGQALYLYKPHHLEIVLTSPNSQKKSYFYAFFGKVIEDSLLGIDGKLWRDRRKSWSVLIDSKVINPYVEDIGRYAELLADKIQDRVGQTFDAKDDISKSSIDLLLGIDPSCTQAGDFLTSANIVHHLFVMRVIGVIKHIRFLYNNTKEGNMLHSAIKVLDNIVDEVIDEREKIYKDNILNEVCVEDRRQNKFIDHLFNLGFSRYTIQTETKLFIHAGYETTFTAISFGLLMLAMHQEVQEKAYQEVLEVLGEDRPIQASDMPKLVYLKQVIKETMRLFPSVPHVARVTTGEITIDGNVVPKETQIILSIFHAHRSPLLWKDPLVFDPERFTPEEEKKRVDFSYLPFSGGPRTCIGRPFAMLNLIATLATLLRRYKWYTPYKSVEDIELAITMVTEPTDGFLLRPEERK